MKATPQPWATSRLAVHASWVAVNVSWVAVNVSRLCGAGLLMVALTVSLEAQSAPLLSLRPDPDGHELPRAAPGTRVALDGRMDEGVWQEARRLNVIHQLRPNEGEPASEETEVRVFYDEEAFYVGAFLREQDPSRISTRTLERDSYHRIQQDGFALILDTNGDQRTGVGFIVTPGGSRTDVAIFDEATVSWNTDWNAFWDAATATQPEGWSVEMRIPFSSLRFEPDPNGVVEMGLLLWRYLARSDEMVVFPAIPNDWGNSAYKPGLASRVSFRDIGATRPVYLKPYLLGGWERRNAWDEGQGGFVATGTTLQDVGGDLKYNVTSNLVLDLTANTDFAQVEADDQRFNLDRFSLFFPEKRDFFQERSDLFNFRLPGGTDRLFHSRAIGIADGQPVPIHGGARLTGRVGEWDLGFLNMQTGQARLASREVPSENFGVLRLQRSVLDQGSFVGGLVTSRGNLDGTHNLVYALNADLHLGGNHFIGLQAGGSRDWGTTAAHGGMATVVLQRRINRGLSFGHSYGYVGPSFQPAMGFLRRGGTNRWGHRTQYTWFPALTSRIQNHSLAHRFEFVWDHDFRLLETNNSSLTWDVTLRSGSSAQGRFEYAREVLDTGFQVGGVGIPAGRYTFLTGSLQYASPPGADLQVGTELNGGGYFGGHRAGASASLTWNLGARLSLGVESGGNRITLPSGSETVVISRLRAGTALTRTLTADAFVQHNSNARMVTPNLRIRYNPREGSDLYLVYNEAVHTSLYRDDPLTPRLPRTSFRSVQVKYTYTFVR